MINTFKIQDTTLYADATTNNRLTIRSHPFNYDVVFETFSNSFAENEIVLVDSNVKKLYGIDHKKIIQIDATETNKSIHTVLDICDKLSSYNFDKGCTLIVIGGGILQDLGAFVAKIYKRGINWIFVPTTLLSQCDSCIGGKTALNFNNHKNQLALFSAPTKVIIDSNFINTLTKADVVSGYGEVVKLFLIGGDWYINNLNTMTKDEMIYHSLLIKKAVIECDEFEYNERKALNLGHSFGHVIEPLTDYSIPHGEAVMLGIEIINRLFVKSEKITSLIMKYTSLDKIKNINLQALVSGLKTDKKVANGAITFIVTPIPGTTLYKEVNIDNVTNEMLYDIFTY